MNPGSAHLSPARKEAGSPTHNIYSETASGPFVLLMRSFKHLNWHLKASVIQIHKTITDSSDESSILAYSN
jgi:hypothetical protein